MNPIYWLEIIKTTRINKHLSHHFILKVNQKYMIFTSKPVDGVKSHLISNENIKGEAKKQYLIEKIHQIDPINMILKKTENGITYYDTHFVKLQPMIEKMQPIIEKIT